MIGFALSTIGIVAIAVAALVLLLIAGGWAAATRRARDREPSLRDELDRAQRALSAAQALDRGWDPAVMEAAARKLAAERVGASEVCEPVLVQVIDKPGTDEDQAIYRVVTGDGDDLRLTLGRSGDVWGPAPS